MVVTNDDPVFVKEQPSSPEMRRRGLKKHPGVRAKEAKFATETIEERAERLREADDVHKLQHVFAQVGTKQQQAATNDGDGDDHDEEAADDTQQGKMFLFQLPPLTPFLVDPATMIKGEDEDEVKNEPSVENSAPGERGETKKEDPDTLQSLSSKPHLQLDGLLTATEPTRLPSGLVGKLRLHKSGKVSLDWGGTDMEVRYGSEVDFLQDVVMVQSHIKQEGEEEEETKKDGDGDGDGDDDRPDELGNKKEKSKFTGRAYALGQVRKKMVLIPDWAKLYD
jgi:DNA-directed RNA polymerase III subunit RPC4